MSEEAQPITPKKIVPVGMAQEREIVQPIVVVTPAALASFIMALPTEPHPHLVGDHHDPVSFGTEAGVLLVVCFVAAFDLWHRWREQSNHASQ